jgi:hypothetical protein
MTLPLHRKSTVQPMADRVEKGLSAALATPYLTQDDARRKVPSAPDLAGERPRVWRVTWNAFPHLSRYGYRGRIGTGGVLLIVLIIYLLVGRGRF